MTKFESWCRQPGNTSYLREMAPRIAAWFMLADEGYPVSIAEISDDTSIPPYIVRRMLGGWIELENARAMKELH